MSEAEKAITDAYEFMKQHRDKVHEEVAQFMFDSALLILQNTEVINERRYNAYLWAQERKQSGL